MDVVVVNVLKRKEGQLDARIVGGKKAQNQVRCLNVALSVYRGASWIRFSPSKHSFCLLLGARKSQAGTPNICRTLLT